MTTTTAFQRDLRANTNVSTQAYVRRPAAPYERHHFVYEQIRSLLERDPLLKLLDLGCGAGGFLAYLKARHPRLRCYGLEKDRALLDRAKAQASLRDAVWIHADLRRFTPRERFDIVHMAGVLSIFDDLKLPIRKMASALRPGGVGWIFGGFCSRDIDVLVRYRNRHQESRRWESGLNMFSLRTVREALAPYAARIAFHAFTLSRDLEPQPDPIRSFTVMTRERGRMIITGANIIREFYLIEFTKRSTTHG